MNQFLPLLFTVFAAPLFGQDCPIHKDDPIVCEWASTCQVSRGQINISDPSIMDAGTNLASYGVAENALGPANNSVVSLGDGGHAIVTFDTPISNRPGYDLAVFENSFSDPTLGPPYFLELAFVEVSSDGINFFRFPSTSNTQTSTQIGGFEAMDNSGLKNLAGKYTLYYGTPFDLEELAGTPGLDINNITHVKIIDVVGCIQDEYATYDSFGNKVNDPWPTNFGSGGFDLDAVAVLDQSNSSTTGKFNTNDIKIDPNPTNGVININYEQDKISEVRIYNTLGNLVLSKDNINSNNTSIDISTAANGFYLIHISTNSGKNVRSSCIKR